MKDLINPVQKVPLANKLIYLFFGLQTLFCTAQNELTDKEYEIINSVFQKSGTNIYETTIYEKGWKHYFDNIEEITENVGIPTSITDKELKGKLNDEVLKQIFSKISNLKPYKLSSKMINSSIKLFEDFDSQKAFKKGVFRISKPIIINNKIAVIKKVSPKESPIFILENQRGEWRIIYTFYDWYILE